LTARPDLLLHSGPSKADPVISFAKFHSVTANTELTLCPVPPKNVSANFSTANFSRPMSPPAYVQREEIVRPKFTTEQLVPSGGLFTVEKHAFYHTIPRTSIRERFEWRCAVGLFGHTKGHECGGLKLVRMQNGATVAVYAGLGHSSRRSNPGRVMGMFRFLRGDGVIGLEEEWEMLSVMSLLAVLERGRQRSVALFA
jgi:hypothetical protein